MCGRYTLFLQGKLKERYQASNELELRANYNVAPGQIMPVITRNSPNKIELMKWGLVPSWAKDPKIGYKMINARGETVAEKPSFRSALKKRRCLVPSTGFYEWKREGDVKTAMLIKCLDQEIFSMAGLYEHWQDDHGNELMTYTIITTSPNKLMESIHDRMPVILGKDQEEEWLNPDVEDPAQLQRLLNPYDTKVMEAYPVSSDVNSPRNNVAQLVERVA